MARQAAGLEQGPPEQELHGHFTRAIALLLNDHVLKAVAPGLLTGKLSDVAGRRGRSPGRLGGTIVLAGGVGWGLSLLLRAAAPTPSA
jgi:hypothetical protein